MNLEYGPANGYTRTEPGELRASVGPAATAPVELRFTSRDDWQAGLRQHLLALDCSVADAQTFDGKAVVARLRGMTVAELRVDAALFVRRAADIEATGDDPIQFVWQLAGRSRLRQGPNSGTLEAGAWTLCNPARHYALEFGRGSRILVVLVPRVLCPGWLPALGALGASALPAGGPSSIALAALTAMLRDAAPLDAQSETTLHDLIVALLERALAIELEARGLEALAQPTIRLPQVQAYILEHLADPRLNVARIASVFGMSRRSLYNLFAPSGVTPHVFIQGARLDRACQLLGHPASRTTAVASIARRCGFGDPAHFSRAFHARHGVAPGAWRDRA